MVGTPANIISLFRRAEESRSRYDERGDINDLVASVQLLQEARSCIAPDDDYLPIILYHLAASWHDLNCNDPSMTQVISYLKEAVDAIEVKDNDRGHALSALNTNLLKRFQPPHGTDSFLDPHSLKMAEATRIHGESFDTAEVCKLYRKLAEVYKTRNERAIEKDPWDIDSRLVAMIKASCLIDRTDSDTPILLSNIGSAFSQRYERTKLREDLDDGISYGVQSMNACELCEVAQGDQQIVHFSLSQSYWRRYKLLHRRSDIELSYEQSEIANRLLPVVHPRAIDNTLRQQDLAQVRYDVTQMLNHLDDMINDKNY